MKISSSCSACCFIQESEVETVKAAGTDVQFQASFIVGCEN